ncbi:phosphoenolpyruvate synthase regulatory protein [Vagococcus penaei]|uniref:Putative pyruvate, phosphate dikinase regulatory protein n=1 Tax=Vagococcus penaei TaxID=633807 RepID=A0A1Q2D751_9ENTE|nr:pyruvate, water dikinase regulatory protein [Vagococcus penaei]AQP54238.1 phosphoenolpyruvate synthase regulatory protein [Vagococcus penaei]RST98237.1 phosphoenolpyruvate synthase regulatory protein [Vagococcus penaei]
MNTLQERREKKLTLFVISDSIGETAQRVIHAVLAQFPSLEDYDIQTFPFIDSAESLGGILRDALKEKAVVITTLVSQELTEVCQEFCERTGLEWLDYMTPLLSVVAKRTHLTPSYESGSQYRLNQDYFKRVEAMEFAVRYDDGKEAKGFLKADIVILGVSRTSKTPLSMYLANKSYKVANLPLIPEVSLPKEIDELEGKVVIGLTANANYLMSVRQSRLASLGLQGTSSYVELERIKAELAYARDVFEKTGAYVIDVTNQSIEETAQQIMTYATSQQLKLKA